MKFAYFMNTYPMTSSTFIRNEIAAHEEAGIEVKRYALRRWKHELVEPRDKLELEQTCYLLDQGPAGLISAFIREALSNPKSMFYAIRTVVSMMMVARGKRAVQLIYLLEASVLKRKAIEEKIDHFHTHFSTNSASVALLSNLLGGPTFSMTVHGPDELFEMRENSLKLKVEKTKFVAAISNFCKSVVDDHTEGKHTDKLHLVRCGLDSDEFDQPYPVPDVKRLVCVGRFCKAKAHLILMQAFSRVIKNHPDATLTLIGDGEQRAAIEGAISDLGLEKHVELVGWKPSSGVRKELIASRGMVLPSLYEGLPIVIMESLALGRPVVTTKINGIPELVDNTCGWLATPNDIESLVDSLNSILTTKTMQLNEMGKAGAKRTQKMHNQKMNAHILRELFSRDAN